jgi:hypothetical protein
MKNLFKSIYDFMRNKTDLEITVLSLAQCLYVRGLNSFNDMSKIGQKYWIDKYDDTLPKLVDEEIKRGKEDKKWMKMAISSAGKLYNKDMINV